ncbi:MAG: hypothetical protein KA015_01230 [Spirochaetes bacterium]|nr:hypothetical protein [Spirochaetota bacterium]
MIKKQAAFAALLLILFQGNAAHAENYFSSSGSAIKSTNGKFYAYINFLYYSNIYFVNLIQPNSVSHNDVQNDSSKIRAYQNYIRTLRDDNLRNEAVVLLNLYKNPSQFDKEKIEQISKKLESRNIVISFSTEDNLSRKINLNYCIYGKKKLLLVTHPLFDYSETIYNIVPMISYPEISVSNSMTYDDIIYVSQEEIANDSGIAQRVLAGKNVSAFLFNGARVNSEISYCLRKAFTGKESDIVKDMTRMFEIHELCHKILYNKYKIQDPVTHEEFALSSTIYDNPYLGLAIMYSYLDYDNLTQHKLAALNYIRFIANHSGKSILMEKPEQLAKEFTADEIKLITKNHFDSLRQVLRIK